MRGVSNRTWIGGPRTELRDVIETIRALPFGFVGGTWSRNTEVVPTNPNTWEGFALTARVDFDDLLNAGGLGLTIPDGLEGVYVVAVAGATTTNQGIMRVIRGTDTLVQLDVDTTPRFAQSPAVALNPGDTLTWQYQAPNVLFWLQGDTASPMANLPYVSIHRLGLLP